MRVQIKKWIDASIIYEGDHDDVKSAVEHCADNHICLDYASLNGARLDNARLDNASLDYASLNGASLDNASLNGTSLDNASLNGTSLDNASLDNASLNGASLDYASLNGASLYGVVGDSSKIKSLFFDAYPVVYTDKYMQIGCEKHLISEWRDFDDKRILGMEGRKALAFWRKYKEFIFTVVQLSPAEPAGDKDDDCNI